MYPNRGLFAAIALVVTSTNSSAQQITPPTAVPLKVVSLKRHSPEWDVRTTIWLKADGIDVQNLMFEITAAPEKGTLTCNKDCAQGKCAVSDPNPALDPPKDRSRTCRCEYYPITGRSGEDYFYYNATTEAPSTETSNDLPRAVARSQPAKVDIDIRTRGLRWEFTPAGTTGLSSDLDSPADIPSVFGKTAQDFMFALNWVTDFPHRELKESFRNRAKAANRLEENRFTLTRNELQSRRSRSFNVIVRTGLVTTPMTVEAVDRGSALVNPTSQTPSPAPEKSASLRRAFTVGGEANLNAVWKFDGQGSFLELGAVGKGNFDVATETEAAEIKADRLFELIRRERGVSRVEGGLRMALKRDGGENDTTLLVAGDKVEHGRNTEDLLILEALVQRNNALTDLPAADGESQNRWLFRFSAMPTLPILPANVRPMLGLEVSRAIAGGEKIIRFIYGGNLGIK